MRVVGMCTVNWDGRVGTVVCAVGTSILDLSTGVSTWCVTPRGTLDVPVKGERDWVYSEFPDVSLRIFGYPRAKWGC